MRNLVAQSIIALLGLSLAYPVRAQNSLQYDAPGNLLTQTSQSTGLPVILHPPTQQVVSAGNNGSFSVVVADTASVTYQWLFQGTKIPGAGADALLLTNVTAASQGNYSVVVANASGSVTSAPAMLWWDSVGDGLPDSWKIEYFGSLTNVTAAGDAVGDGVSNLEKFYEGINPTNGAGLYPRLFVNGLNGGVTVSPNLAKFTLGQVVTLTAVPAPGFQFVGWNGDLAGTQNPVTLTMNASKTVTAVFSLPLGYAVDATNLVWRSGGDVPWFGQNYVTYDGIAAAQSGPIATNQQSWMETTLVMDAPGTVSFWWKYVAGSGTLTFAINGVVETGVSFQDSDWQQAIFYLPAGKDVLRWTYSKGSDDSNSQGFDAFWVDQVVTTVYTDPLLDTDNDGLPDLWEYRYFANLGYSGTDDPDNDGVNNHDEYLDGTDPTDPTSVFPRLAVSAVGGAVTVSPALAKYAYLQPVTLTAIPGPGLTFARWSGDLSGTTNPITLNINRSLIARAVFIMSSPDSLGQALDATNLTWLTGGDAPWFGQKAITHDGVDAAQSGSISDPNQVSWIQTTVTGPGPLSFWWNSAPGYCCADYEFAIDNAMQTNFSAGAWEQQTFNIPAGTHVLQWTYTNSPAGGSPLNAAWLDQVSFGTGVPTLTSLPVSKTVLQGSNVTFAVAATSSATISYQWQRDGTDLVNGGSISGATSDTLALSNVQTNDGGNYSVIVGTATGTASSAATLTVIGLVPLAQALDTPTWVWTSGGRTAWFGQTSVSHDGQSAGQSGAISGGQQSWVQTTLTGPGKLSFWWKVSGDPADFLLFLINGTTNASISGQVDWVPRVFAIPSGSQSLRWQAIPLFNREKGWLDQVVFTPGSPPIITSQPQPQTVAFGSNATFTVSATGGSPLSYQWIFAGTDISGATTTSLTITNVQTANAGDYAVVVSNAVGSVISADAELTVTGSPPIPLQGLIGELANGSVSIQFAGTPNATYIVLGATNVSLPLVNWTALGPATEYSSGLFQFIDSQTSKSSQRFYRVRSP